LWKGDKQEGMPPIVSVVGKSKSGKTTLIEKLVGELRLRGYCVATIKHAQDIDFEPGKDSWRHLQAGSEATAISSRDKVVLIKPTAPAATLDEIARLLGDDYDIILTEGFKQAKTPKIEVRRRQAGPPLGNIDRVIAIVTDEPIKTKTRKFSTQDVKGLTDLLEKGFIKPQRNRLTLYINNAPIPLTVFPRQIISNILVAMASSLKGVKEISSLDIFLRRQPK